MNIALEDTADVADGNARFLNLGRGRVMPPTAYNHAAHSGDRQDRRLRRAMSLVSGVTLSDDTETCRRLEQLAWQGDPLSDHALVALESLGINPMAAIDTLVREGIDGFDHPPASLRALWAHIADEPAWLDWALLERGARAYRRFGVSGFEYQGVVTLEGYRKESIAQPLMATGEYSDDTAFNRFLLTCNFWAEVSEAGGMQRFQGGWHTAVRVRLLHTLIRRRVLLSGNWDAERLGMPINQVGLLAAPILSSLGMAQHMRLMGFATSRGDIEAMMHLWRYVAHIMGVEAGLFPETLEAGVQMIYNISRLEGISSAEDGRRLGASFVGAFKPLHEETGRSPRQRLQRWLQYRGVIAQTAFYISPATRRFVGTPHPLPWAVPYWLVQFPKNLLVSAGTRASSRLDAAYDRRVSLRRRQWLTRYIQPAGVKYQPAG